MRYFFHLRESGSLVLDEEGLDLVDLDAVAAAAIAGARSVIAGEVMSGRIPISAVIEVDDEHGRRVLDLPLRDAVRWTADGHRAATDPPEPEPRQPHARSALFPDLMLKSAVR